MDRQCQTRVRDYSSGKQTAEGKFRRPDKPQIEIETINGSRVTGRRTNDQHLLKNLETKWKTNVTRD